MEVVEEVVDRVTEDPDGGAAANEERLPPPVVVLEHIVSTNQLSKQKPFLPRSIVAGK